MNILATTPQSDNDQLANGELVIGLACAVGTDIAAVISIIEKQLLLFGYNSIIIKISHDLIESSFEKNFTMSNSAYDRVNLLMDQGNQIRQKNGKNYILASGVANLINQRRNNEPMPRTAFIIDSLKHPEEADKLREIYPAGFYLFAINESEEDRRNYLINNKNMGRTDANRLIHRDMNETESYGQHTRDVFELADFHLSTISHSSPPPAKEKTLEMQIIRIIKLIFGYPFSTPTFDEFAMFMAYSSGLRSADLSRQVGAVIAKNNEIISTGANDVPSYGGGQYWPDDNYADIPKGRDYTLSYDSNKKELQHIVDEIVDMFEFDNNDKKILAKQSLLKSSLKNLTEFGRPVHAEMAAILSCARNGISLNGATLYCSTFPCHNCAKHIIAAGITRVVYIEPYPKSKTLDLYNDSITINGESNKVQFVEFVGIGPRRFYDLFSMGLSTGARILRKNEDGNCVDWQEDTARVRCQMLSSSYLDKEAMEALKWTGRDK